MLHHEVTGNGPPVLLLHAGVADSRMWDPQWHGLAERHRVIRCDLYGFGRSPVPDHEFVHADAVAEVLDAAGVDQAALVGASFGGLVALEFATLHPHRVSQLVLLAPPLEQVALTADFEQFIEEEDRLLEAGDVDGATELNVRSWLGPEAHESVQEMVRVMQRNAFDLQRSAVGEPREVELFAEDIAAPAQVFVGAHDFEFFHRAGEYLEQHMPNAQLTRLDWAGHLPTLERPQEGLELLRASLAR